MMDKDILMEFARGNLDWADLDKETKSLLIRILCDRFLNLEEVD